MTNYASVLAVPWLCLSLELVKGVQAGDYCNTRIYSYGIETEYCHFGCCGTYSNQYCCSLAVGLIVAIVLCAIAALCLLVGLIICCMKKQSYQGRVVGPQNPGNVTVVNSSAYQKRRTVEAEKKRAAASSQMAASTSYQPPPQQPMGYQQNPQYGPSLQPEYPEKQPPPAYIYNNPTFVNDASVPGQVGYAAPGPTNYAANGSAGCVFFFCKRSI